MAGGTSRLMQRRAAAGGGRRLRLGVGSGRAVSAHLLAMNRVVTAANSSEASWLPPCCCERPCATFIASGCC